MAETLKVLGQADLAATTLTAVYTVPSSTEAAVSSIVICNRNAAAIKYRVSIAVAGAADTNKQYVAYDVSLAGNTTDILKFQPGLSATDVVRAYSDTANVSVNVLGLERVA